MLKIAFFNFLKKENLIEKSYNFCIFYDQIAEIPMNNFKIFNLEK